MMNFRFSSRDSSPNTFVFGHSKRTVLTCVGLLTPLSWQQLVLPTLMMIPKRAVTYTRAIMFVFLPGFCWHNCAPSQVCGEHLIKSLDRFFVSDTLVCVPIAGGASPSTGTSRRGFALYVGAAMLMLGRDDRLGIPPRHTLSQFLFWTVFALGVALHMYCAQRPPAGEQHC